MRFTGTRSHVGGIVALAFLAVSLLPLSLKAQNATGSLLGEVQDASGARIKSADVVVTDNGSGVARKVATDNHGQFLFPDLIPGNYHIAVNAQGFAEAGADVTVQVSVVRDVLVTLRPAAVQQTVNVKAEPVMKTLAPAAPAMRAGARICCITSAMS